MDLADSLEIERYRFVTDRQKYFTELARDAFASYMRLFSGLGAGAVALVSTWNKLEIKPDVLVFLIRVILVLVTFLGIVASAQIVYCLTRWWGYRQGERDINSDSPPIRQGWWIFESLYIAAILVTVGGAWFVANRLPMIVDSGALALQPSYNPRIDNYWAGALIGFFAGIVASIVANKIWELVTRLRAHGIAKRLAGEWTEHNMDGRNVGRQTEEPGAGLTLISAKPWWRAWVADSHVLDVSAIDRDSKRRHDGPLVVDPLCPRLATRIVLYADSDEISEQRIVIIRDFNTLYVFPVDTVATLGPSAYHRHALCRKTS